VSWLGVGNLVSVLFAVGNEPLIHRWEQRRDRRATIRWIAHLVLPYALYCVADPTGGIEHNFFWRQVPRATAPILGRESRSFVHIGIAAAVWAIATAVAVFFFSRRGLQIAETQK
jgi:ABC-type Fe3+ transport system permease subunit